MASWTEEPGLVAWSFLVSSWAFLIASPSADVMTSPRRNPAFAAGLFC